MKDFTRVVPCAEESEAAEFIAQTIGVPTSDMELLFQAMPAQDRQDLTRMAQALERARRRRHE